MKDLEIKEATNQEIKPYIADDKDHTRANNHTEYKLGDEYTPEELASIKNDQLKELEKIIDEKINNSSEELSLYNLIFLENMITDIVTMPKYYIPINSLTNKIDELVSKAPCNTKLDKKAKKILTICNKEFRKNHRLSSSTETELHNIRLEYYRNFEQ